MFTLGSIAWSSFVLGVMIYDSDLYNQAFYLDNSNRRILIVPLHPFSRETCKDKFPHLWETLSVSVTWVI
jgi:hypothetical protein